MSTAVLTIKLMRLLASRRPDLRESQQAAIVAKILRLPSDHAGLDRDTNVRLSPDAQALIDATARPEPTTTQPTTTDAAPDTSGPFFGPVFAAVEAAYPELTSLERVTLASKVVASGGVGFAADKSLVFMPVARDIASKLPYSTNPERDARARAYDAARSNAAPSATTAPASTAANTGPNADALRAELDAVRGNDDRSRARRASIRASLIRANDPAVAAAAERDPNRP